MCYLEKRRLKSGIDGFISQLCPFLAVQLWGSYLPSLSLSFSLCNSGVSQSHPENQVGASGAQ